jgi:DNA-binding transcriptional MerR regulator
LMQATGVSLKEVEEILTHRESQSGLQEKASRNG